MAAPLRLALFDCDGTLVDSQQGIIAAMREAWQAHDLDVPDPEAVRRVVGLTLEAAIARLRPQAGDDERKDLAERYRAAFFRQRQSGTLEEPLYDGVIAALDALEAEGVLLGVATGKSRRGLRAVLEHHGLLDRFVTLQTADDGPGKPNPHMVHQALDATGVDAADTVMIGDTTFDIQMARAAGVASIGVGWGYHPAEELSAAGAGAVASTFPDIPGLVMTMLSG